MQKLPDLCYMPKDFFSTQASSYAKFRPHYPQELFDYIFSFVKEKNCAWDCATGNGQAAKVLADHFKKVEATDISEAQLQNAVQKGNIHYQISSAEQTPFADGSFDLITVATAYHWLDWEAFYKEATRVGKHDAVVAIWAYNLLSANEEEINKAIQYCYVEIVGPYWHKERSHVADEYQTIPFAFSPLPSKNFQQKLYWNKDQLLGYFSSWSATANYTKQNGHSPLPRMIEAINNAWPGDVTKEFTIRFFLKIGRVAK